MPFSCDRRPKNRTYGRAPACASSNLCVFATRAPIAICESVRTFCMVMVRPAYPPSSSLLFMNSEGAIIASILSYEWRYFRNSASTEASRLLARDPFTQAFFTACMKCLSKQASHTSPCPLTIVYAGQTRM